MDYNTIGIMPGVEIATKKGQVWGEAQSAKKHGHSIRRNPPERGKKNHRGFLNAICGSKGKRGTWECCAM